MERFTLVLLLLFFVSSAAAEPMSDEDWQQYFAPKARDEETYQATVTDIFGRPMTMIQKQRSKGEVTIDGQTFTKFVVLHDKGPFAGKPIEVLLVPRPLSIGQRWTSANAAFTFEGYEDYDTFGGVVKHCAKFTFSNEKTTGVKYYEKGRGLIFKNEGAGALGASKILRDYASAPAQ